MSLVELLGRAIGKKFNTNPEQLLCHAVWHVRRKQHTGLKMWSSRAAVYNTLCHMHRCQRTTCLFHAWTNSIGKRFHDVRTLAGWDMWLPGIRPAPGQRYHWDPWPRWEEHQFLYCLECPAVLGMAHIQATKRRAVCMWLSWDKRNRHRTIWNNHGPWKLKMAPWMNIVLYKQVMFHFHDYFS